MTRSPEQKIAAARGEYIERIKRELAECQRKLAAAEATMQTVADKLVRWDDYDEPDILDIIGLLEAQDTAAFDAALEQARAEGAAEERERVARMRASDEGGNH